MQIFVSDIPCSPNDHIHWAKRYRHDAPLKEEVAWQAKVHAGQHGRWARVHVKVVFRRRGGPRYDLHDNAPATCKVLIDGLVEGGLLVNDNAGRVQLEVEQKWGRRREAVMTITGLEKEEESIDGHSDGNDG